MTSPDTPPLQVDSVGARHGSALLAAVESGQLCFLVGDPLQPRVLQASNKQTLASAAGASRWCRRRRAAEGGREGRRPHVPRFVGLNFFHLFQAAGVPRASRLVSLAPSAPQVVASDSHI